MRLPCRADNYPPVGHVAPFQGWKSLAQAIWQCCVWQGSPQDSQLLRYSRLQTWASQLKHLKPGSGKMWWRRDHLEWYQLRPRNGCFKLNWNDGWIGCPSYLWGQVCGACDVTTPNINASDPTLEPRMIWMWDSKRTRVPHLHIPLIFFTTTVKVAIYRESFGPLVLKHSQSVSFWHHTFLTLLLDHLRHMREVLCSSRQNFHIKDDLANHRSSMPIQHSPIAFSSTPPLVFL